MLIILYSSLISYMLFFSFCIAPPVNIILDRENSSKLLRKIFPRNFWFGILLSSASGFFSYNEGNVSSLIISSIIFFSFILNLFLVMPAINKQADLGKKNKNYSKNFKVLHSISIGLYLVNIILTLIALYKLI